MKLYLVILLLSCFLNASSQKRQDDFKRMIDSALYLDSYSLHEYIKKIGKEPPLEVRYLINESDVAYIYTSPFDDIKFKYINVFSQKSEAVLKEGILAWKIFTSLQENRFIINIIEFTITYKNGIYNYGNGGGSDTIFEYSCDKNKWILIKSKWSGN